MVNISDIIADREQNREYYNKIELEYTFRLANGTGQEQEAESFQKYCQGIAEKIMGAKHDFENEPVRFTVSDTKEEVNAAYILPGEWSPTHQIVITTGLLERLETEDELAFVLGHELAHLDYYKKFGTTRPSKGEEAYADIFAIYSMESAKYDPKVALSFREKFTPNPSEDNEATIFAILDEHLLKRNNLGIIKGALTDLNRKHNIDAMQPTPINKEMIKSFTSLSHTTFIDGAKTKTRQELYDYLYDHQGLIFFMDKVEEDVVSYLNAQNLETDKDKDGYTDFLKRFMQPFSDSKDQFGKTDPFGEEEWRKFKFVLKLNEEYLEQINIQEISAFKEIAKDMTRFMEAETYEQAVQAAFDLFQNGRAIGIAAAREDFMDLPFWKAATREVLSNLNWWKFRHSFPAFEAPCPTAIETATETVPWQKYIDWMKKHDNDNFAINSDGDLVERDSSQAFDLSPNGLFVLRPNDLIVRALYIFHIKDYRLQRYKHWYDSIYDTLNSITEPFYMSEGKRVDFMLSYDAFDDYDEPGKYAITHDGRAFSFDDKDTKKCKRYKIYCKTYGNKEYKMYSEAFQEYMNNRNPRIKECIEQPIDFDRLSSNASELKTYLDKLSFIKSYTVPKEWDALSPGYHHPILNGIHFDKRNFDYDLELDIDDALAELYKRGHHSYQDEFEDKMLFHHIASVLPIIKKFSNDEKRQFVDTLVEIFSHRTTPIQKLILAPLLAETGIKEILIPEIKLTILHKVIESSVVDETISNTAKAISNFIGISSADTETTEASGKEQAPFVALQSNIAKMEQFYEDNIWDNSIDSPRIHNVFYVSYMDGDSSRLSFDKQKEQDLPYAKAALILDYMTRKEDHTFDLSKLEGLGGAYLATYKFRAKGSRQILAPFVENEANWPTDLDKQISVYSFLKNNSLFPSDRAFQKEKTEDILLRIAQLPKDEQKVECLQKLLVKKERIPDPDLRSCAIDMYTGVVAKILGEDDQTPEYLQDVEKYIEPLRHVDLGAEAKKEQGLYADDDLEIARKLSDKILSQEKVSQYLKPDLSLTKEDMKDSLVLGRIVESITTVLDRNPEAAKRTIDFLINPNDPENPKNAAGYLDFLQESLDRIHGEQFNQQFKQECTPEDMVLLHDNYWAASTEIRAGFMARILESTTKEEGTQAWEQIFDFVMDRMLDPNSSDIDDIKIILHSYIASKAEYEREFILAGMLTAAQKTDEHAIPRGVALRKFLEGMGPAEIKLGQAIGSYPDTPEDIKKEMQELKSSAKPPARWEIFEWMEKEMPEGYRKGIAKLGELLGSASYFAACRIHKTNGETAVVGLLRPEAQILRRGVVPKDQEAGKIGFDALLATAEKLEQHEEKYKDLAKVMKQLIGQVLRSSDNELNMKIGSEQADLAHEKIYGGKTAMVDEYTFTFHSASWNCYGENFKEMKEVKGVHFNDLPEASEEDKKYRIAVAKAYLTLELGNMLSGNIMDHDRHGAQLKIDKATDTIGIFDNGALSIKPPTKEDKIALGKVLGTVYDAAINKQDLMKAFEKEIGELSNQNKLPDYLLETQKALLALQDFMKAVPSEQLSDVIVSALRDYQADQDIVDGFAQTTKKCQSVQDKFEILNRSSLLKNLLIRTSVHIIHGMPEKREKAYFIEKIEKPEQSKKEFVASIIQAASGLTERILSEVHRHGSVNNRSYNRTFTC
ncbi:MAG: M48 family metallopeptidase [Alphaproteobacteria bacterium]|nr:M48 family metallopeptidase [Alphaproteobacteria bacterium]MCL2505158.1 M48 family metallopeptidase [Alphaproteobacteria bacterium]